jgi:murein DD-endopeptidase MepM/ murein hydrolase activator NlpD
MRVIRLLSASLTAVLCLVWAAPDVSAQRTPGLDDARVRAREATQAIEDLQVELAALEDEAAAAEAERAAADAELAGLREEVARLAVVRYTQPDEVALFEPGGDLNRQVRADALARSVSDENLDAVDQYRATKARLEDASDRLAATRAEQEAALDELEERQEELYAELATLEEVERARLAEEQRQREEEARRQAEERARQAAATSTTTSTTAPTTTAPGGSTVAPGATPAPSAPTTGGQAPTTATPAPPPTSVAPPPPTSPPPSGGWVCPVRGPVSFVDSWGAPRPGGRAHRGVDLMSPRGTPVVIPVSGTVSQRSNSVGGLSFHLLGDDGNYYYGTHMDAYASIPSGRLPAGTVVGYVGDTGDARGTGTHLHFEIHLGGQGNAVNPYPTVAAHC